MPALRSLNEKLRSSRACRIADIAFLEDAPPDSGMILLGARREWLVPSIPCMKRDDPNGIDERSFRFYCDVLDFLDTVPIDPKTKRLIEQLADSSGSTTGNRDEALGGSSKREFLRYNEFALRGANESVKWLRACLARRYGDPAQCKRLLDEGRQLARILGRIVITTKRNLGLLGPDTDKDTGT